MNNSDVAGLLRTYSEKCERAYSDEKLKELIRDLKYELRYEEIEKMRVVKD
ncbi:hypothetical protein [Vallitalea guaymasensis]|uniref:hypothetical protein n=1 Tax=Vallitalea guaymasensis TaxID=1185412 RepID=UPI00187D5673|nr:hypothetical protein [Vallitalea guaymasensis]